MLCNFSCFDYVREEKYLILRNDFASGTALAKEGGGGLGGL